MSMGYILDLYKSKVWKINLKREESFFTLLQFAENKSLSKTQVTNLITNSVFKSANKNTSERLERLLRLKLIKMGTEKLENLEHGKKYYRITSIGLFYIVCQLYPKRTFRGISKILKSHYNDPLFRYLIDPFFEKDIISRLTRIDIKEHIAKYFYDCCKLIYEQLFDLYDRIEKHGHIFHEIVVWDDIPDLPHMEHKLYLDIFLSKLRKDNDELKWLNKHKKLGIIKTNDDSITVSQNGKNVHIILNESAGKAELHFCDKKIHEYAIQRFVTVANRKEGFMLGEFKNSNVEEIHEFELSYLPKFEEFAENLALSIVKGLYESYFTISDIKEYSTQSTDRYLLVRDKKFLKLTRSVESKMKQCFNSFLE